MPEHRNPVQEYRGGRLSHPRVCQAHPMAPQQPRDLLPDVQAQKTSLRLINCN